MGAESLVCARQWASQFPLRRYRWYVGYPSPDLPVVETGASLILPRKPPDHAPPEAPRRPPTRSGFGWRKGGARPRP